MEKKICVLIPSYNESATIKNVIRDLEDHGYPVFVVDDGSTDGSATLAVDAGATVIKHPVNMGKGAALRNGFKRVADEGYDEVIVMDADGQHKSEDIPAFIKKMDEVNAGMIIGNRMEDTSSMPLVRVLTNRFMSWMLSKVAGQYVPDTQSGFRLIKCDVLKNIRLNCSNFEIESELIIKAARKGYKIDSVPIKTVYANEVSKVHPVYDTIRFIMFMFENMRSRD